MKGLNIKEYNKIVNETRKIFEEKSELYGDCDTLGSKAEFIQIFRKFSRLKKMAWDNDLVGCEKKYNDTIEDTVKDLINYCIIFLYVYRNEK